MYAFHNDDWAVREFSDAMRAKMKFSREVKGRSGWDDPAQYSIDDLKRMLADHVKKGDPVDIANFCMMIWHRERTETSS